MAASSKTDHVETMLSVNPYLPVNLEERAKEKQRIADEQHASMDRLLDCLDPTVAKRYEDAKPLYEWKVECRIFRPATPRSHARMEEVTQQVVAQNEGDAWAMFCDAQGEWPSRPKVRPKITRLKKRTLRDTSEAHEEL